MGKLENEGGKHLIRGQELRHLGFSDICYSINQQVLVSFTSWISNSILQLCHVIRTVCFSFLFWINILDDPLPHMVASTFPKLYKPFLLEPNDPFILECYSIGDWVLTWLSWALLSMQEDVGLSV